MRSVSIPGIEIGGELGRGAYSVVYRAKQGGVPCAVKLPLTHGRWTRWVYREAVALARVRHPGLATVLEVGEFDDVPYLVMELVEGETLKSRLARSALGEGESLGLASQLASALDAMHQVGLVHRDVKPRNILLGRDGRARLVDFGFATPFHLAGRDEERAGTRGYTAPEQFLPSAPVDGRADLYALGRVIEDCFGGDLQRLSDREMVARVGPMLAGLVVDDPERRYPDAHALIVELETLRAGQPARGAAAYLPQRRNRALVGRSDELARVNQSWLDGAVALVLGPRGAGKSRLVDASAEKARSLGGRRVIEVSCREADPPLAALRRIVTEYVRTLRDRPDAVGAVVDGRLAPFARLIAPELFVGIHDVHGIGEVAAGGFAEGAAELLLRFARRWGPALLVIDDLQWIDPVSRETIIALATRPRDSSFSMVLAARSPSTAGVDAFVTMDRARVRVIELTPFRSAETARLVAAYLGPVRADPAVAVRIESLADGTPLGILEVLGAFLDSGAVRPFAGSWELDTDRVARVALPVGALALLRRRIAELPPATRRVLEVAATLGARFDDPLVARALEIGSADLEHAFADARQAGFLVAEENRHRFVHDSVRETLLDEVDEGGKRRLHQCVAETLVREGGTTFERQCEIATHYAAGEIGKDPSAAYRHTRLAAAAALARFDNETALHYFEIARACAAVGGLALDVEFEISVGEAQLRLGRARESVQAFEAALRGSSDPDERAFILGKIAWAHQAEARPEEAWSALERAFAAVGATMPVETAASTARTVAHVARRVWGAVPAPDLAKRIELLCNLHYQNGRLGVEYGKPVRFIESTIAALRMSDALGPGRVRARAGALYALMLTVLGFGAAGATEIALDREMADQVKDPQLQGFVLQMHAMVASYRGAFDEALELWRACLDEYGPWLELNEYCLNATTGDHIESVRGRATEAMAWTTRATDRQQRSWPSVPVSARYLATRASASRASLGRDPERLTPLADAIPVRSFEEAIAWGPRARVFLETDQLGSSFEEFVAGFEAGGHNPRTAHVALSEYYIAVAHARVTQCLRAAPAQQSEYLTRLRHASAELRAAARVPLYRSHALFIDACVAWFDGDEARATRLFAEAEDLARAETCPWVLSEVARMRAHALLRAGKDDAMLIQAGIAEALAREHGAVCRARRIRDEFALPELVVPTQSRSSWSSLRSSDRANRRLAAMLHAVRRSFGGQGPEEQAVALLDDALVDLRSDRAAIMFRPEGAVGDGLLLGRARDKHAVTVDAARLDELRSVATSGEPWPGEADTLRATAGRRQVLVSPLLLGTSAAGAISFERSAGASFSSEDRDIAMLLSYQVPVVLEISRLLRERERLQASLIRGHRLEAVGQLAGGVANDVNNLVTIIRHSLEGISRRTWLATDFREDLQAISGATERAATLMSQLIAVSRHQPAAPAHCSVNTVISELVPMLQRMVGHDISVDVDLAPDAHPVVVDRGGFDQALVNLAANARDAMPGGGTLRIRTRNLDGAITEATPAQIRIDVEDTGTGMRADTLARAFDPFFTTKLHGEASGLGLTTVYAFARNSGGHVDVSSEVGTGTIVRLSLPAALAPSPERAASPPVPVLSAACPAKTILVVDDDPYIRRMMERTLVEGNHNVLLAANGGEALRLVALHKADISMVILDVLMPGMTGGELGRRLALECSAKQLFISGYSPEHLPAGSHGGSEFLQKPFTPSELLARVRRMLDG